MIIGRGWSELFSTGRSSAVWRFCDSFSSAISADFGSNFSLDSAAASFRHRSFLHRVARPIELKEITKATRNFGAGMFIGRGLLCEAFIAWIDEHALTAMEPGSGMAVTVKRWHTSLQERHQDWLKDIEFLMQLRHPNLVELVGFCWEEDNMILVYEFLSEGSLKDRYLARAIPFPWEMRIKVALDVARGLSYLHDREIPVIHRDLKIANIFFDTDLNAKLSNYCYGTDDPAGDTTRVYTHQVFSAHGYTAPEYVSKGYLTTKSNVYTFGIILLELLTGIRAPNRNWKKQDLGKKKKVLQIMDVRLEGKYSVDAAFEVAKLASNCLCLDPESRPRMVDVVVELQHLQRM